MKLEEVKRNLNRHVKFRGMDYILTACIIRKSKERKYFYQVELQDTTKNNSIVIARLEEVNGK